MKLAISIFSFLLTINLPAQRIIEWSNPSFEDEPRMGEVPEGWQNCGPVDETPPDIQPSPDPASPYFGVQHLALDGETYLSLSTRDNNTWESLGQQLSEPLLAGEKYEFSVYLARSDDFVSVSRSSMREVPFTQPVILKVYGGNAPCEKLELLGETTPVDHWEWMEYRFSFVPQQSVNHLMFEVFYETLIDGPYNGHVLIDHCSAILEGGLEALKADFMTYSPKQLLEWTQRCGAERRQKPLYELTERLVYVESIHEVFVFEELISKMGMRQYITAQSVESLAVPIKCLELLKMNRSAALLKELALIHLRAKEKDGVTKEEQERFERADELMLETLQTEVPTDKAIRFIEVHKESVVDELIRCRRIWRLSGNLRISLCSLRQKKSSRSNPSCN